MKEYEEPYLWYESFYVEHSSVYSVELKGKSRVVFHGFLNLIQGEKPDSLREWKSRYS